MLRNTLLCRHGRMHAKCSHNKRRNTCRKCKGSQQCPHNDYANRKANCPACRAIRNGLKLTRSHIPLGTSLKRKRHQSKVPPSIERTSKNTGTSDEKKERANKRKRNTYHARQLKRLKSGQVEKGSAIYPCLDLGHFAKFHSIEFYVCLWCLESVGRSQKCCKLSIRVVPGCSGVFRGLSP